MTEGMAYLLPVRNRTRRHFLSPYFFLWLMPAIHYAASFEVAFTMTPPNLVPGSEASMTCLLTGDMTGVKNISSITMGRRQTFETAFVQVSQRSGFVIAEIMKGVVTGKGQLSADLKQSYLSLQINRMSCSDTGIFYCEIVVDANIIYKLASAVINYTQPETVLNEEQYNPCTGRGDANSEKAKSKSLLIGLMIALNGLLYP